MEFLIVVIIIIASVYSEMNKQKKENGDIDLSDLMSIDDFSVSKPKKYSSVPTPVTPMPAKKRKKISKSKKDTSTPPMPEDLPVIDHAPDTFEKGLEGKPEAKLNCDNKLTQKSTKVDMRLSREQLIKSFIFSEILQRHDINRIYDRIPSIREDD